MTPKHIEAIFINLEAILIVNKEFLRALEERAAESAIIEQVSDIFLKSAEKFIGYSLYCSHQQSSLSKLKELSGKNAVKSFIEDAYKTSATRGLDLNAFLIKPVQRLCKYPLLIRV
jgi:hypothetical protein